LVSYSHRLELHEESFPEQSTNVLTKENIGNGAATSRTMLLQ